MSKFAYLAFDFETGGTNAQKNPILTGHFSALDSDLNIIGQLDIKVRPDEEFNLVEEDALKVNGIVMSSHLEDKETISRQEAGQRLLAFIQEMSKGLPAKSAKPRPLGHNIAFDINFIPQLIDMKTWNKYVHYGFVCTFSISSFLKAAGILPETIGNLGSLVKHFNVQQRSAHDAKEDVLMTIDCYGKMVGMIKHMANNTGGSLTVDLLSALEK